MEKIIYPDNTKKQEAIRRPVKSKLELENIVYEIFSEIKQHGDKALIKYTKKFDKVSLKSLEVSADTIAESENKISPQLREAIKIAAENIRKFHESQKEQPKVIETVKGVKCWRESRAIERVGIYIPGGSAPLFSTVLMLAIPAKIAGCKEIILCTPPSANGINPAILFAAKLTGVTKVFSVGGIQAIGAMSYGTESIPKADKIFGPGNQYVTMAKQIAQIICNVSIDMPAGPSEVLIIADNSCNPAFVAADLLSQAEHGADSQVLLLTNDETIIEAVSKEIETQLKALPRKEIAEESLKNARLIVLKSLDECIELSNTYAPEHLILVCENALKITPKITNAGSVFIGNYSCESAGDYASGTNHTLPTNGYAKNYSGVSLDSFIKKITFQQISKEGINNIGSTIEIMAETEELIAHKNAVTIRLNEN